MHMNKAFRIDLANKRTVCCAKTFVCCRFVYNRMLEIKPCIMTPLRSRYTSLSNTKPSLSGWGSGFTRTVKRGFTSRSGFPKFLLINQ
jgi:hypothetical protein